MANSHFGNLGDVWKHLVLAAVLEREPPRWYAETHAGSAAYPLNHDPQREFGIWRFLATAPRSAELARSRYYAIAGSCASASPATYPGSPLLAMTILGNSSSYLLCDLDPGSAADLRSWSRQLGVRHCEVAGVDGMAAVAAYLARGEGGGDGLVHVDPFEPDAAGPGGASALECAAGVANSGSALVFWYATGQDPEPDGVPARLRALTDAPLWCGEVAVVTRDVSARDVRRAATPGRVGVVLAQVQPATAGACAALGQALAEAYADATLPAGPPARLTFTSRWLPASGRTFAEGSQGQLLLILVRRGALNGGGSGHPGILSPFHKYKTRPIGELKRLALDLRTKRRHTACSSPDGDKSGRTSSRRWLAACRCCRFRPVAPCAES